MASHGQMASDPHSDELGPRLARSREDQLQNLQAVREGTRVFTAYELRDGVCWFSWKWRNRSTVKIMERTHEEATEALHAEEKVAILRRHLLEQVPISELCDRQGLQPTVFYRWQKGATCSIRCEQCARSRTASSECWSLDMIRVLPGAKR